MSEMWAFEGVVMHNVHRRSVCGPQSWPCWIHDKGYSEPLTGRRLVERGQYRGLAHCPARIALGYVCGCDVVHPVWADAVYLWQVRGMETITDHRCQCGCCLPIPEAVLPFLPSGDDR